MPTRTCTVVFTDLANYSATVGRSDREGLRNLIATHEQMVAPVLERFGGRVVKNLGDSYMALFEAATDAVRAGTELVEAISKEGGFSIRVAMATGDVEVIDGDAFGDAVNTASRILAKTPDAEVRFSKTTQLCMNQSEIAWERVGLFSLKGIVREVEVFRSVPPSRAWLPLPLARALKSGRLIRVRRGEQLPNLPPRPMILLEGFVPGSANLANLVDRLPVVDPASLWLLVYNIPPEDRANWESAGRGLVVGQPDSLERTLVEHSRPTSMTGSDTIILDVSGNAELDLVLAGLALPAVPMGDVVASYSYDLLADGRWVNQSEAAMARVEVKPTGVTLLPLSAGVLVGGRQVDLGVPISLVDGMEIATATGVMNFMQIANSAYMGLIYSETLARMGLGMGQVAEVGREPNHPGLAVPDRRGQQNIQWCVGSRAARARQSGFTLDRALAGRRQCSIGMEEGRAVLSTLHSRCPTYLLSESNLTQVNETCTVKTGDLVVVGTSVVAVKEPL